MKFMFLVIYQDHRQDKLRRWHEETLAEGLTHDAMAEQESQTRVEALMEQVFDQIGGFNVLKDNG